MATPRLAAARQFAEVTSTDYVEALLERGKQRAAAERLPVTFKQADAEALPFAMGLLRCGVIDFWCDVRSKSGDRCGRTLPRRSQGGRIGLANWTPDGFIGQLFKIIGKHVAPPAGIKSPRFGEPKVASVSCFAVTS